MNVEDKPVTWGCLGGLVIWVLAAVGILVTIGLVLPIRLTKHLGGG